MTWDLFLYYLGYAIALWLCKDLGKVFLYPMLINMGFNIALNFGAFAGFDSRWVIAIYGFLFFVWVATLAGAFDRITVVVLLLVELVVVVKGLLPQFQAVGTGFSFWHLTSTVVLQIWMFSILVVCLSAIFKSSILSVWERGYSELLIIPKRRFLVPIALWSLIWTLPHLMSGQIPAVVQQYKSQIAGQLLVWGWVAFELPFYMMYKRRYRNGDA